MKNQMCGIILSVWLLSECIEAKKYCWYFEGGYPIYFICRSYEDCCGTRCCVRALSIQRLWYFWLLLMMGVLFCCGAGFFIRRRSYPSPVSEEPAFNVFFTRQPVSTPGCRVESVPGSCSTCWMVRQFWSQPPGMQTYSDPSNIMVPPLAPAYQVQPSSAHMMASYPPPPSYCNHSPPPYEQVFSTPEKK
ncbi:vesicular, overexpressed in cancer, prosurvival protein 1 isoform X1 [Brienomyrus brachyistius]|uniref:vesicular, overexpressed in cancer, prosurvival protein 1 isoform X1 n=1 Tax=Brienomyrus brachyistius TaxID=42636 RepID=UPI0020B403A1|nr:vesicular, overexpressed in cancer, prosurvival protein 1 isoform X1 [Brienomyrus brachyistius]